MGLNGWKHNSTKLVIGRNEVSLRGANLQKEKHPLLHWRTGPQSSIENDRVMRGENPTDSSLIVQNWKCPREGFRAKRRIYFLLFYAGKGDLLKNISPLPGVIR